MMPAPRVTPELLRQLLAYEPNTGIMIWKPRSVEMFNNASWARRWNERYAGTEAFARTDKDGYRRGTVLGRAHQGHRVAWAIHFGVWPIHQIDHENGNKVDNRIENMRDVTQIENGKNQRKPRNNSSGRVGVSHRNGRWVATITVNRKTVHLGQFALASQAIAARQHAENQHGFHRNHGRSI